MNLNRISDINVILAALSKSQQDVFYTIIKTPSQPEEMVAMKATNSIDDRNVALMLVAQVKSLNKQERDVLWQLPHFQNN